MSPEMMIEDVEGMVKLQEELGEYPHIVSIYRSFRWENGWYGIMTKWMPDGKLSDKLRDGGDGGLVSSLKPRYVLRQIVDGVKVCHDHNVVHLDLQPAHVLFDGSDVKIDSFESAMKVYGKTRLPPLSGHYKFAYLAPERIAAWVNQRSSGRIPIPLDLKAVDIWALGVIFYQVLAGRSPWNCNMNSDKEVADCLKRIKDSGFDDIYVPLPNTVHLYHRDAEDLLRHMLEIDPSKRYTIDQVASHRFFNSAAAYLSFFPF
jgi:serine/threonine protein kinase